MFTLTDRSLPVAYTLILPTNTNMSQVETYMFHSYRSQLATYTCKLATPANGKQLPILTQVTDSNFQTCPSYRHYDMLGDDHSFILLAPGPGSLGEQPGLLQHLAV